MKIGGIDLEQPFALAPMAGMTDCKAVFPASATSIAVNSRRKCGVDIAVPAIPLREARERITAL